MFAEFIRIAQKKRAQQLLLYRIEHLHSPRMVLQRDCCILGYTFIRFIKQQKDDRPLTSCCIW